MLYIARMDGLIIPPTRFLPLGRVLKVSLIAPAFNEGEEIVDFLCSTMSILDKLGHEYEILAQVTIVSNRHAQDRKSRELDEHVI